MSRIGLRFAVLAFMLCAAPAMAQEDMSPPQPVSAEPAIPAADPSVPPAQTQMSMAMREQAEKKARVDAFFQGDINPAEIPSLLFTFWEHTAILDARRSRGMVRPPTEEELASGLDPTLEKVRPPPEKREVWLGGIAYISPVEWTIWLNGQRVTPKALPPEAIDLKVYKEYIEVKWYDDFSNQIFPIRLRPHERFNVDTRIFLPGVF